jgi:Ca-activated chloride channel homolog
MNRISIGGRFAAALALTFLVAACGGGTASPTPVPPTATPASGAVPTASAAATQGATGPASLEALDTVEAGVELEVTWTGPNAEGDFVTIVTAGATEWTNEDYFYTTEGSPSRLTIPSAAGDYELWYVSGADEAVLARRPLSVTPFTGSLFGPEEVTANTQFDVAWNGPNGPGDYVTIVPEGVERWTNESYFYTTVGPTGTLLAPIEAGVYELWYVIGSDSSVQARRPITVTEAHATLDGPASADAGAQFEVTWSGPDGPGDFVTIVEAGAADSAYLSYFYTRDGNPGTLTAPNSSGDYELRYVPGQADVVIVSVPITVK